MSVSVLAVTKDMSRETWLQQRMVGIGGSDAAVVAGVSKWKSPIGLWLEKTGQVEPDEAGEAAYWGTTLEKIVATEFTIRTGLKVRRRNAILQHHEYPFMLANVDRLIVGQDIGLECKTASAYLKDRWEDDEVPDAYYIQCQHYMAVTGYSGWHIAVLIGGNTFVTKYIERNDTFIEKLIDIEADFWNKVQTKTMPAVDGSDASAEALKTLYEQADGSEIVLPVGANAWVEAYSQADQSEKEAKERKDLAKNKLCELLGQAERGHAGDRLVVWSNVAGRTTIDSKALKTKYPDIYSQVSKSGTASRRFSLK